MRNVQWGARNRERRHLWRSKRWRGPWCRPCPKRRRRLRSGRACRSRAWWALTLLRIPPWRIRAPWLLPPWGAGPGRAGTGWQSKGSGSGGLGRRGSWEGYGGGEGGPSPSLWGGTPLMMLQWRVREEQVWSFGRVTYQLGLTGTGFI